MGERLEESDATLSIDRGLGERLECVLNRPLATFSEIVEILDLNPSVDFQYADLSGIDFGKADISRYNFAGSNLEGSNLRDTLGYEAAENNGAFKDANLRKAILPRKSSSKNLDPSSLSKAMGILAGFLGGFAQGLFGESQNDSGQYKALVLQTGLGGYWPHAKMDTEGGPWDLIRTEILRQDNTSLSILSASGFATFGNADSPLFSVLEEFKGTVRVILSDPSRIYNDGRAGAVSTSAHEYRREIHLSVRRLRNLKKEHRAIVEGRFYAGQPNWKLIITDRTIWLQYYCSTGVSVNETSIYRFDITEQLGFFHMFRSDFERIWQESKSMPMRVSV